MIWPYRECGSLVVRAAIVQKESMFHGCILAFRYEDLVFTYNSYLFSKSYNRTYNIIIHVDVHSMIKL